MRFLLSALCGVLLAGACWAEGGMEPAAGGSPLDVLKQLAPAGGGPSGGFLPPDRAFVFNHHAADAKTVRLIWDIASNYYLYREKFQFKIPDGQARIGQFEMPHGEAKEDPNFGKVEVFHGHVEVRLPIEPIDPNAREIKLTVGYQGCAEDGLCYPPIEKEVLVSLPDPGAPVPASSSSSANGNTPPAVPAAGTSAPSTTSAASTGAMGMSDDQQIAGLLAKRSPVWIFITFLGFGMLLSLTPCVFPMVPILSGIIVGHGPNLSAAKGLLLSSVYVLSMAFTYSVIGVVAAIFGQNLQAVFQNPWVISAFSLLFVVLALSMFGLYRIQLPASWQGHLAAISHHQEHSTLHGVAVMGLLSALIVGPCVAPPLAGTLLYIGKTGNAVLGGSALMALGLGMGVPLLAVGASAGRFLPKAGHWMEAVNRFFGVVMLGMAIWFLDRIVPPPVTLALWALLLIGTAIFWGALDSMDSTVTVWERIRKAVCLAMLVYGGTLIIGAAAGGTSVWQPLKGIGLGRDHEGLRFTTVKGLDGLRTAVAQAQRAAKPTAVDFYADWCVECKDMERDTFSDAEVRKLMSRASLIKIDVTANDAKDREVLKEFELYGPPAMLFFGADGQERRAHRLIGYKAPPEFKLHAEQGLKP